MEIFYGKLNRLKGKKISRLVERKKDWIFLSGWGKG